MPGQYSENRCSVATLGMFIIDEFKRDGRFELISKQPGGAGLYTSLGARIWLPDGQALFVIDRGHDFPSAIQTTLDSFNNKRSFCFRDDKSRKTTLALNVYSSNQGEIRGFEYLTPRKRLNPRDLMDARKVTLPPKYLHCVCAAGRATEIIEEIKELGWMQDTRLCFEPIPDLCAPSELVSLTKVLPDVDIFSPNHTEAAAFFGGEPLVDPQRGVVEQLARKYLDLGAKNKIIIRCGALGACGLSRSNPDCCIWVPAFHQDQVNVKDPTGGGNSFLGGLLAGLSLHPNNLREAMLYGSISASYFIEQYGMPQMSVRQTTPETNERTELWNVPAEQPEKRLETLRQRIQ